MPASGRTLRVDQASSPTLITIPSMAATGSEAVARESVETLSHRYAPIWDLAAAGGTPAAIAQATGQPIGQVELILALRRPAEVPHG